MKWTTDKPKVPGWYWCEWRSTPYFSRGGPYPIEVRETNSGLIAHIPTGDDRGFFPYQVCGFWALWSDAPISFPTEQWYDYKDPVRKNIRLAAKAAEGWSGPTYDPVKADLQAAAMNNAADDGIDRTPSPDKPFPPWLSEGKGNP